MFSTSALIVRRTGCLAAVALISLSSPMVSNLGARELSLEEAVTIASERDTRGQSFEAKARAFEESAVADRQWPDPTVKLGVANLPARSFKFDQEPMTQAQIGYQQVIPRGRSLTVKSARTEAMAARERSMRADREASVTLNVRRAWLDLFYWIGAKSIVLSEYSAMTSLIGAIESLYAAGRQKQQDLVSAELELSLIDDRLVDIDRQIDLSRSELARWIGRDDSRRRLTQEFPSIAMPATRDDLEEGLLKHPRVLFADTLIEIGDRNVDLAEEDYKPQWRVDLTYGFREGDDPLGRSREDFASLMLMFDLPLFTGDRQDRRLSARKYEASSARLDRTDTLRELSKVLEVEYSNWERLGERESLYRRVVLERSGLNLEAAQSAYQNDIVPFADLIRAQLSEYRTQRDLLRVKVDRAKAQSALLYLMGDR